MSNFVSLRVSHEKLQQLQHNTERIRNICILAHVDHGKTTFSDSLVSANCIISEKLAGRIRFLDNTEEEQIRGITMKSSAISLMYQPASADASSDAPNNDETPIEDPFLINLVDSPGHVDFSFDVSTAVRLCDGALVLVDVVEGVCAQTHAVIRQAWKEGIRACLVLNKMDRLIFELQLSPYEAYQRLCRVLEQANAILSSMIREEMLRNEESTQDDEEEGTTNASNGTDAAIDETALLERQVLFSPQNGNVLFASAVDGWAFGIAYFAQWYAKRLELPPRVMRQALWGEYYLNPKTKKITSKPINSSQMPMFVSLILQPIWEAHKTVIKPIKSEEDLEPVRKLTRQLRIAKLIPERELKHTDRKLALQSVMRRWLPLAGNALRMVTKALPNPVVAQANRTERLCAGTKSSTQMQTMEAVTSIERCIIAPEAPVVVYICKMISVEASLLSDYQRVTGESAGGMDGTSSEVYVAMGRVFSGVLKAGSPLYVLGPKFQGLPAGQVGEHVDVTKLEHVTQVSPDMIRLYMLMGRELHALDQVPAGNIVGIVGLHDHILKTATLCSTMNCPSLAKMPYQAKPVVRVAVEPEDPRHFAELEAGLQRLYRSDPTVEVQVQQTGEHVIVALGELHLEHCIKDLKERFARVPVRVSPPLVGFRESLIEGSVSTLQESIVFRDFLPPSAATPNVTTAPAHSPGKPDKSGNDTSDKPEARVSEGTTPDGSVTLKIRAIPLPSALAKLIEEKADVVRQITSHGTTSDESTSDAAESVEVTEVTTSEENDSVAPTEEDSNEVQQFVVQFEKLLRKSPNSFWKQLDMSQIWSFGPRRVGPNMLINNIPWHRLGNGILQGVMKSADTTKPTESDDSDPARSELLTKLMNSIVTGFQLAAAAGPLCEEPVWGVAFIVEDFGTREQNEGDDETSSEAAANSSGNYGPLSGQVISTMKNTCRFAFVKQPVRLVEAIYVCTVQCQSEQLGKLYSVLGKRRGDVFHEELSDGTSLFTIKAHLPVVESFGFATDLLSQTSGAASNPQLVFSHWSVIDMDPFFQPTTEEEREDMGERVYEFNFVRKYIDATRKRKGLASDEKIVVHAEKQRTLARKK